MVEIEINQSIFDTKLYTISGLEYLDGDEIDLTKVELEELFEKMLPYLEFNKVYRVLDQRLKQIHRMNLENK